jgi:hypothetical protein
MGSLANDPFAQDVPSMVPTIAMQPGRGAFGPNDFALSAHEPLNFDLGMTGFGMDPLFPDPFFPALNEPWNDTQLQHVVAAPPAAIAAPPSAAPIQVAAPARTGPLTCPRGCHGTFGRPGDFRRHMKKHEAPRFRCIFHDCAKTFYRFDKLRAHVQKGHKSNLMDLH